jgi:prepilin-type processing-associated H-X9-DG protein
MEKHVPGQPDIYGSYGWVPWVSFPHVDWTDRDYYWRTADVRGANNIPVQLDSCSPGAWLVDEGHPPPEFDAVPDASGRVPDSCINRHDGFVNSVFLDWSVRKIGLKELWTLKWHRKYNTAGPWTKAGHVQPKDWPQWMRGFKDY